MTRYFLYENSTLPQPPPTPCSDGNYATQQSTLPPPPPPPTPPSKGGLSTEATTGISVGTVIAFLSLLLGVVKLVMRCREKKKNNQKLNGTLSITSLSGEFENKIQEVN
ncbi:uncharacterized protein LOC115989031 [Quercus lobata]|uniref:uncharacterized protein LOC115989031 n=1 Tax=Quercus lobata TaxID=97700 RepID=UPI0012486041|nr:uncharacterized protein LOC115989031 [Quercus lobata]